MDKKKKLDIIIGSMLVATIVLFLAFVICVLPPQEEQEKTDWPEHSYVVTHKNITKWVNLTLPNATYIGKTISVTFDNAIVVSNSSILWNMCNETYITYTQRNGSNDLEYWHWETNIIAYCNVDGTYYYQYIVAHNSGEGLHWTLSYKWYDTVTVTPIEDNDTWAFKINIFRETVECVWE